MRARLSQEGLFNYVYCLDFAQQDFVVVLICLLFVPERDHCAGLRMLVDHDDRRSIASIASLDVPSDRFLLALQSGAVDDLRKSLLSQILE